MSRVSENSSANSVKFSINKAKQKLEDLQIKGSTLKSINRPSDHPINSVESLSITSITNDNKQYIRNSSYADIQLSVTESVLEGLTEILSKAKEIAIAQSSDLYNADVRKNIADEVTQLKDQALSLGNKRIGNRYLFSGLATLTRPFDREGNYYGDNGTTSVEVAKDFFVPINLTGAEIFFSQAPNNSLMEISPPEQPVATRGLASLPVGPTKDFKEHNHIFGQLDLLANALENNDAETIRNLLESLDNSLSRIITLRTKIGSIQNNLRISKTNIESDNLGHEERKSKLIDADVAELFSDLTKQQEVLNTTYKASSSLINKNLLDFLR